MLSLARRRVTGDLLATVGSRSVQILLGLAGNVVSARSLGPADFGRFGLIMSVIMVCGTLADAGLTYTAIRFIARYSEDGSPRGYAVAHSYLLLRVCSGVLVALLGVTLAWPLAWALGYADLTPYLQIAFATLVALSLSSYPGTILVGLSLFGRSAIAGVLNAAITLSGILFLFFVGTLSLGTLVAWNVILPLLSTLPAWFLIPPEWLPWRVIGVRRALASALTEARELVNFSKWMGVSLVASMLVAQGDLLLLGRLSTPAIVGTYSVALALASRLDTLNQSLFTVLMPRASRLRGAESMKRYGRQVAVGSGLLAVGLGILALVAQPAILLLYGERYEASSGIFLALLGVVLFDLATSSLFLLAFPLNKPRLLAAADWLRVGVLGIAGWSLIPIYGAFGAVASRFLARLTGTVAALWALLRAIKTTEEEDENSPR